MFREEEKIRAYEQKKGKRKIKLRLIKEMVSKRMKKTKTKPRSPKIKKIIKSKNGKIK